MVNLLTLAADGEASGSKVALTVAAVAETEVEAVAIAEFPEFKAFTIKELPPQAAELASISLKTTLVNLKYVLSNSVTGVIFIDVSHVAVVATPCPNSTVLDVLILIVAARTPPPIPKPTNAKSAMTHLG